MERIGQKKGRQYYDTATRPNHVTFDDGRQRKRNFPWGHYVEARWDYEEPETISQGFNFRMGNAPLYSGYDYFGRQAFVQLATKF